MDIRQTFPSNYLRAADVAARPNKTARVTIHGIKMEAMKGKNGSDDSKPVLYFRGAKKGLVLNKTNADRIAHHYGWDTDKWMGQPLDLYVAEVEAFGEQVDAIRVKVPPQSGIQAATPTAPQPGLQRHTEPMQEDPLGAGPPLDDFEPPGADEEPPF